MTRGTEIRLDPAALRHNARRVKTLAPHSDCYAVVKANAYGHGSAWVASQLQGLVEGFCVAVLDEALALREAGCDAPILVMQGPLSESDAALFRQQGLEACVISRELLDRLPSDLPFWLKVDSGMHRLGVPKTEVPACLDQIRERKLAWQGWFSHFACADESDHPLTARQLSSMKELVADYPAPLCLSNSAAIFRLPEAHGQRVRPGIMLYGSSPLLDRDARALELEPVMSLASRVLMVQQVPAGESVGYGASWVARRDSRIAVIACGYGDGYPRHAPTGTPVAIGHGRTAPLVGRVSMDTLAVDVTDYPDIQTGSEVELWGRSLSVDTVAQHCGTISYELFCKITSRVPRRYLS